MSPRSIARTSPTTACMPASTSSTPSTAGNVPAICRHHHHLLLLRRLDLTWLPSRLKAIDIETMSALQEKVNIIPLIAKADTLTQPELKTLKAKVPSPALQSPL